ncbi:MAG: hypothetical protein ACI8Z5_002086 [Lentimonas sp.]
MGIGINLCILEKLDGSSVRRQSPFTVTDFFLGIENVTRDSTYIRPKLSKNIDEVCYPVLYEKSLKCDFEILTDELCRQVDGILAEMPEAFPGVVAELEVSQREASCGGSHSSLAICPGQLLNSCMRILLIGALLSLFVGVVQGQEAGLPPKYDISPYIAKLPAQSDFFGTWLRSDGTYSVEVEAGESVGTVVARYFNPNPINVETAVFDEIEGQPRLEFVLRDEGYPGSAYRLIFLAERRVLVGTYMRPGGEPSEVFFVRKDAQ